MVFNSLNHDFLFSYIDRAPEYEY